MYAGLDNNKLRKVFPVSTNVWGFCLPDKRDQLLELHTNLTFVQSRLLEILHGQLRDAEAREVQQQVVERHWTEFTMLMEESFELISANATNLIRELFMGLLRLQSFTRDSVRYVAEELQSLEVEVRDVRGELRQVHDGIDDIATTGISKVRQLAEISQQRLSMVHMCCL